MDPIYGYQAVNVSLQTNLPRLLLHWTRKMIEIRQRHPSSASAPTSNYRLQPIRPGLHREITEDESPWDEMDTVLCVANLSRFPAVGLGGRRFDYSPSSAWAASSSRPSANSRTC